MFILFAKSLNHFKLWQEFTDAKQKQSFIQIKHFLKTYPHWPLEEKIIKKGELYINETTPHHIALDWFHKHKPISIQACNIYIEHLPRDKKIHEIRQVWQTRDMSLNEQNLWFQKYKKHLNHKSHQRRIDLLCISADEKNLIALREILPEFKEQINFRLKLLKGESNLTLPSHPPRGLILNYIQYLRNQNDFTKIAELLKNFTKDQNTFALQWSYERQRVAKELVQQKKYKEAYDILNCTGLRNTAAKNDILVLKTEIGYHLLNFRKELIHDYKTIYKHAIHPTIKSFSAYYLGLLHDHNWFKKAAHFPTTFFGQKALKALNKQSPHFIKTHKFNTKKNDLIKTLFKMDTCNKDLLLKFIEAVVKRDIRDIDQGASFIDAIGKKFGPPYSLWTGFYIQKKFHKIPKLKSLYPRLPSIKNPLILGLIKQESLFDPSAQSNANAMGYMQLITKTASKYAGRSVTDREVFNPQNNLKWGQIYLKDIASFYNQCWPLILSDYNAGDHRVKKWIEVYGDPRKDISEDKYIALIPFKETKHYVMQVLANKKVYEELINTTSAPAV